MDTIVNRRCYHVNMQTSNEPGLSYGVGDIITMPLDWKHGPEWMACDARQLRRTRYPDLYAVISTAYGSAAGDKWFRLPLLDESPYPGPVEAQCYIYVGERSQP